MLSRILPLCLLAAPCLAQNAARMDEIVQTYVANRQFMRCAVVPRDAEVLYSKGFGSANLEWDMLNAPNTKFRLGSITKQFTAASILLLGEFAIVEGDAKATQLTLHQNGRSITGKRLDAVSDRFAHTHSIRLISGSPPTYFARSSSRLRNRAPPGGWNNLVGSTRVVNTGC
jgi:hypothetical protein